jgi:hypothetical protein
MHTVLSHASLFTNRGGPSYDWFEHGAQTRSRRLAGESVDSPVDEPITLANVRAERRREVIGVTNGFERRSAAGDTGVDQWANARHVVPGVVCICKKA